MTIAADILNLCALINSGLALEGVAALVGAHEVQARLVGRDGPGAVEIAVKDDLCIAVTAIEFFNIDTSSSQTIALAQGGTATSPALTTEVAFGGDLLYVFSPGIAKLTFAFTPIDDGVTSHVRVRYYILPKRAQRILERCAMR